MLKVDSVHEISDGNGGTMHAKITALTPHRVDFVTRKSNRGRWSKATESWGRQKWRKAQIGG